MNLFLLRCFHKSVIIHTVNIDICKPFRIHPWCTVNTSHRLETIYDIRLQPDPKNAELVHARWAGGYHTDHCFASVLTSEVQVDAIVDHRSPRGLRRREDCFWVRVLCSNDCIGKRPLPLRRDVDVKFPRRSLVSNFDLIN